MPCPYKAPAPSCGPAPHRWGGGASLRQSCSSPAARLGRERARRINPDLRIVLATQPAAPRQLDPTRLTVTLRDKSGKPVDGATVNVVLTMPDMDMGKNAVALAPGDPGVYVGTGRFTMPGKWSVNVAASTDALHAAQDFPVTVR